MTVAHAVRLTRPGSEPITADAFAVQTEELAPPAEGEVLVRVHYLSLDPYQGIYLRSLLPGDVPPGGAVGQVITGDDVLEAGTWVTGELGWRDHAVVASDALTVIDPHHDIPLHHYVGLLGLSGITAFFGSTAVLRPQPEERIVVSGAFGAVGQIAVQIAVNSGAEVMGLVGSPAKADALARLGAKALNYRDQEWVGQLRDLAPQGVDGYFDNVWGETSARVVEQLRPLGRIALCGQMSGLTDGRVPPLDIDWYLILTRSITLRGFRAVDYRENWPAARATLAQWYLAGELRQEVELVDGLARAGHAFHNLIQGRTTGKVTVRVASGGCGRGGESQPGAAAGVAAAVPGTMLKTEGDKSGRTGDVA